VIKINIIAPELISRCIDLNFAQGTYCSLLK